MAIRAEVRQLEAVQAIIDHGSFNKAAQSLGITQPALSKLVALLERQLGVRLFERSARGAEPTGAARIVQRAASNVGRIVDEIAAELASHASGALGPLAIGVTPSVMQGIVPAAIAALPGGAALSLRVIEDLDDRLTPLLDRGEIDLIVGPVGGLEPPPIRFAEHVLMEDRFFLGVPQDFAVGEDQALSLGDLTDAPWILPAQGSSIHRMIQAFFIASDAPWPHDRIETNSITLQEHLIRHAGRIGLLTSAQMFRRPPPFRLMRLADVPARRIGITKLRSRMLNPLAGIFEETIAGLIAGSPASGTAPGPSL